MTMDVYSLIANNCVFRIFESVNEEEKNIDAYKLTWRDYLILAAIIIVFWLSNDTHSDIINYPEFLKYYGGIALFIVLVIFRFKVFLKKYLEMPKIADRLFYAFISLVLSAAISIIVAGILVTPFNYYNLHVAKQNHADTVRCEIDSANIGARSGDGSEPNTIYYHFGDKQAIIQTHTENFRIANMRQLHTFSQFRLKLTTHKAFLGSYWLEAWKIEDKNALQGKSPK